MVGASGIVTTVSSSPGLREVANLSWQGEAMTWADHIHADPGVQGGKPVIRGTRLAVDFVLGLLA